MTPPAGAASPRFPALFDAIVRNVALTASSCRWPSDAFLPDPHLALLNGVGESFCHDVILAFSAALRDALDPRDYPVVSCTQEMSVLRILLSRLCQKEKQEVARMDTITHRANVLHSTSKLLQLAKDSYTWAQPRTPDEQIGNPRCLRALVTQALEFVQSVEDLIRECHKLSRLRVRWALSAQGVNFSSPEWCLTEHAEPTLVRRRLYAPLLAPSAPSS